MGVTLPPFQKMREGPRNPRDQGGQGPRHPSRAIQELTNKREELHEANDSTTLVEPTGNAEELSEYVVLRVFGG